MKKEIQTRSMCDITRSSRKYCMNYKYVFCYLLPSSYIMDCFIIILNSNNNNL